MDGEFVTIARVAKTQGRIGEVACDLFTDFPEKFAERKRLFALPGSGQKPGQSRRELELEDHWLHKDRVVLKFKGVDSISLAEELIGCEIQIPATERAELEPGAAYVSDLAGCVVLDRGSRVGLIRDVQFGAGDAPVLEVEGTGPYQGQELLIPWANEFVERLDLAAREMHMMLPEGLLEINAPGKKS
jgi:16S rRNA processing protein RimM